MLSGQALIFLACLDVFTSNEVFVRLIRGRSIYTGVFTRTVGVILVALPTIRVIVSSAVVEAFGAVRVDEGEVHDATQGGYEGLTLTSQQVFIRVPER